jgi:hypothetical protein
MPKRMVKPTAQHQAYLETKGSRAAGAGAADVAAPAAAARASRGAYVSMPRIGALPLHAIVESLNVEGGLWRVSVEVERDVLRARQSMQTVGAQQLQPPSLTNPERWRYVQVEWPLAPQTHARPRFFTRLFLIVDSKNASLPRDIAITPDLVYALTTKILTRQLETANTPCA